MITYLSYLLVIVVKVFKFSIFLLRLFSKYTSKVCKYLPFLTQLYGRGWVDKYEIILNNVLKYICKYNLSLVVT